jgi:prolyl-tRNA synthetase
MIRLLTDSSIAIQLTVWASSSGRKYRDELRPRSGLLRAREFIMKDLYTFDASLTDALETYKHVRTAYDRIFSRIGLPFRVVRLFPHGKS